jgi:hypothetical protein
MSTSRFLRWKNSNPDTYQKHLDRRKKRYAEDEAFAEKRREFVRKSVLKKKKRGPRPIKPRLFPHPHTGEMIEHWSVGVCADYWGVSKRQIANLESKGSIPINRHVTSTGRRWWPAAYAKWLKPFFDLRTSREISAKEFSRRVWEEWPEAIASGLVPNLNAENEDGSNREGDRG